MARKIAQGGKFLNPGSAGSTVQWYVSLAEHPSKEYPLDGEVHLSDCTRVIRWDINRISDIKKLRVAATELIKAADAAEAYVNGTK